MAYAPPISPGISGAGGRRCLKLEHKLGFLDGGVGMGGEVRSSPRCLRMLWGGYMDGFKEAGSGHTSRALYHTVGPNTLGLGSRRWSVVAENLNPNMFAKVPEALISPVRANVFLSQQQPHQAIVPIPSGPFE